MRWIAMTFLGLYALIVCRLTLGSTAAVEGAYGATDHVRTLSEAQANVALFVPAGFLLALVLLNPLLATAACFLGSAAIELVQLQFLPMRVPTLDDVWHNGLGGLIGALVAVPLVWLFSRPALARPR